MMMKRNNKTVYGSNFSRTLRRSTREEAKCKTHNMILWRPLYKQIAHKHTLAERDLADDGAASVIHPTRYTYTSPTTNHCASTTIHLPIDSIWLILLAFDSKKQKNNANLIAARVFFLEHLANSPHLYFPLRRRVDARVAAAD